MPTLLIQNANVDGGEGAQWLDLDRKRAAGYDYLTKHPGKILSFFDAHL